MMALSASAMCCPHLRRWEAISICVIEEDVLSCIPAGGDMIRRAFVLDAQRSPMMDSFYLIPMEK